ncbi:MAG: VOC family protein [Culicoidibacterales bacterium]
MANTQVYPRAFSHIGLSVPNIHEAVKFYTEVMGWYVVMGPTTVAEETETAIGIMCEDVFGAGYGGFDIAHLVTSDGIGIELFAFKDYVKPENNLDFRQIGVFHFSVQDPDIEGMVEKIVAHGGKQRMPIREYYPNEQPYKMCYVEDPFGIVFEVYTHSYERTYSQGNY